MCFKYIIPIQGTRSKWKNVQKRLEFIAAEVDKVDAQVKAKTEEQQKIGEIIMKKQQDLRQRAAEEAKKVYEEQMAKQE